MRLFTHNMLSSNIKGVSNGFPLRIEVEQVLEKQVDFNPDFVKNLFPKLEWKALVDGARTLGYAELPEEADSSMLESEEFLRKVHHALLELHLEEGALTCPETGRKFPVTKGIPNMLLHEDEIRVLVLGGLRVLGFSLDTVILGYEDLWKENIAFASMFLVLICKPQYSDATISFGNKSTVAWISQLTNVGVVATTPQV
ncbi:hypothetical protein NC653_014060 [Populus alba x Populus x berolinensis]|uniref:Uncharacterized protein n=1 Tax=Populus alba x Populus x berolinensis TaxID=444605 RepID=A0AAD6W3A1_9ROSI|nr:hypothetical protein NC653_014060 [Populus alba x Populus x berolinensis]